MFLYSIRSAKFEKTSLPSTLKYVPPKFKQGVIILESYSLREFNGFTGLRTGDIHGDDVVCLPQWLHDAHSLLARSIPSHCDNQPSPFPS